MPMRAAEGRDWKKALCALGLLAALGTAGCQSQVGGQTLPSPYYQADDVQYYAEGPEFKLAREAAAQKAAREDESLRARGAEQ